MKRLFASALCACLICLAAVSAYAEEKTLTLVEDWRLTSDMDLNVAEGDVLIVDGNDEHFIYELPGELTNNGDGKVRIKNTEIYPTADKPKDGTLAQLISVAEETDSITSPAKDSKKLTLPTSPEHPDFEFSISSSSNESVIGLDGKINPPEKDTTVTLVLTVDGNGGLAETKEIEVTVPAKSSGSQTTSTPPSIPYTSYSYSGASPAASPKPDNTELAAKAANPGNLADLRSAAPTLADELFKLKLFVGTGTDASGKPIYELNRQLSRIEALALVIRMMGFEDEANAYSGANPFLDGPAWADRILAYAYGQGITVGVNDAHTQFDSNDFVTYQQFTAFLLRVLGYYEKNGDFTFAAAYDKAVASTLYSRSEVNAFSPVSQYLRSDAIVAMTDALLTPVKGESSTVLDKLVESKTITQAEKESFIKAVTEIFER
jgi:hypothetical protein